MIVGLDLSTSCSGITILDEITGAVIKNDCWVLKEESPLEKLIRVKKELELIKKQYTITHVFIEENLQSFRPGLSSAKILLMLAKFNGTVSWLIWEIFGIKPEYIAAGTARKKCGIKIVKGKKAKECVMDHMLNSEKWFEVTYTKTGKIKTFYYDKADSFVIARAGYLTL